MHDNSCSCKLYLVLGLEDGHHGVHGQKPVSVHCADIVPHKFVIGYRHYHDYQKVETEHHFQQSEQREVLPVPEIWKVACKEQRQESSECAIIICQSIKGAVSATPLFLWDDELLTVESRRLEQRLSRTETHFPWICSLFTVIYYGLSRTRLSRTSRYLEQCVRSLGLN